MFYFFLSLDAMKINYFVLGIPFEKFVERTKSQRNDILYLYTTISCLDC